MPVIAYQSFNANSSTTHDLAAISAQRFTLDANAHARAQGHQALVLPHNSGDLATPIHGPAHLRPIEALAAAQPAHVFGDHISLAWQNCWRAIGAMPAIMVVGELDMTDPAVRGLVSDPQMAIQSTPAAKACQSFTAISQSGLAAVIEPLGSGIGYVAYAVGGMVVVFVHVPNSIAGDRQDTTSFYRGISQSLLHQRRIIDLVIGDTNQGSFGFTAAALNAAFGVDVYRNIAGQPGVSPVDNYLVSSGGTNATGTKMYDIAVYRSDRVRVQQHAYISQSAGAVTVTDHCGLVVQAELMAARG